MYSATQLVHTNQSIVMNPSGSVLTANLYLELWTLNNLILLL